MFWILVWIIGTVVGWRLPVRGHLAVHILPPHLLPDPIPVQPGSQVVRLPPPVTDLQGLFLTRLVIFPPGAVHPLIQVVFRVDTPRRIPTSSAGGGPAEQAIIGHDW